MQHEARLGRHLGQSIDRTLGVLDVGGGTARQQGLDQDGGGGTPEDHLSCVDLLGKSRRGQIDRTVDIP